MDETQNVGRESEKENAQKTFQQDLKAVEESAVCLRTPLKTISNDGGSRDQPAFSPITPVSIAKSSTSASGRKLKTPDTYRRVGSVPQAQSQLHVINTLVYNKARDLIEEAVQKERANHEEMKTELLIGKDEEISRLMEENNRLHQQLVVMSMSEKSFTISPLLETGPPRQSTIDNGFVETSDSTKNRNDVICELRAAEISNSILRSELHSFKQKLDLLEPELLQLRSSAEGANRLTDEAVEHVKVSYEEKISKLLAIQLQLTDRISVLETEAVCHQSKMQLCHQQRLHDVDSLNDCIAKLRDDLSLSYKQKRAETERCKNYHVENQITFQKCRELEAQLNEFAKIRPNLEQAKLAQMKASDAIQEAQRTVMENRNKFMSDKEEFLKQKADWQNWKDKQEERLATMQEECEDILKSHASREEQVKNLVDCLAENESEILALANKVTSLEDEVEEERNAKCSLILKLSFCEKEMSEAKEQLTVEVERLEQEVINLQRTIDMRENDIDILTKDRNTHIRLVTNMKAEMSKQQSIILKVADLEAQIKLLAKEKTLVCNEMIDMKKKSNECSEKLQQLTIDYEALQSKLLLEKETKTSLEVILVDREQLLLSKDVELTDLRNSVESLHNKASSVFEGLTSQWKSWNKAGEISKLVEGTPCRRRSSVKTPVKSRRRSSRGHLSFVHQIVSASKRSMTSSSIDSALHSSVTASQVKSTADASRVVHPCSSSSDVSPPTETETPVVKRQNSQDSSGSDIISLRSSSSSDGQHSLILSEIADMFVKMELLLKNEVAVTFNQMRGTIKNLEQSHAKQIKEAQQVVQQVLSEAKPTEQKLQLATRRSADLEVELVKRSKELNDLKKFVNDQLDYATECSNLKKELQRLSAEVTSHANMCEVKDDEIQSLRTVLYNHVECLDAQSGRETLPLIKKMTDDISRLKQQKQDLMYEKIEERRSTESAIFKLQEKILTTKQCLQKAAEAITLLEDKVERALQSFVSHLNEEILQKILHEIQALKRHVRMQLQQC